MLRDAGKVNEMLRTIKNRTKSRTSHTWSTLSIPNKALSKNTHDDTGETVQAGIRDKFYSRLYQHIA